MKDVVNAIWRLRNHELEPGNVQQVLVLRWIGISMNEELVASAMRDLRRMMPQRRNLTLIDIANESDAGEEDDDDVKKRPLSLRSPRSGSSLTATASIWMTLAAFSVHMVHAYPHPTLWTICENTKLDIAKGKQNAFSVPVSSSQTYTARQVLRQIQAMSPQTLAQISRC